MFGRETSGDPIVGQRVLRASSLDEAEDKPTGIRQFVRAPGLQRYVHVGSPWNNPLSHHVIQ